jgi:hypothetical protein
MAALTGEWPLLPKRPAVVRQLPMRPLTTRLRRRTLDRGIIRADAPAGSVTPSADIRAGSHERPDHPIKRASNACGPSISSAAQCLGLLVRFRIDDGDLGDGLVVGL